MERWLLWGSLLAFSAPVYTPSSLSVLLKLSGAPWLLPLCYAPKDNNTPESPEAFLCVISLRRVKTHFVHKEMLFQSHNLRRCQSQVHSLAPARRSEPSFLSHIVLALPNLGVCPTKQMLRKFPSLPLSRLLDNRMEYGLLCSE